MSPRAGRQVVWAVVVLVIVAVFFGIPVSISLANDAAARDVEARLLALPLPEGAERVDSLAQAARITGNGNGMQYLGAMRIRSDLPLDQLETFYAGQSESLGTGATVLATTDADALAGFHGADGFFRDAGEPGLYIVVAWGEAPSPIHAAVDLRGH